MLRNYLTIAWRHLRRNRGYTLLNLAGLAVGLAGCFIIGLYLQLELSFDRYHQRADRIYRLVNRTEGSTLEEGIAKVAAPWGEAAHAEIPEVQNRCRFLPYGETLVTVGRERQFEEGGLYADASAFEVFTWPLLEGEAKTALTAPNSIVLTRSFADKYFPDQEALGQTLTFDHESTYRVTGIMADVPQASHFTFDFLVSLSTYEHPLLQDWQQWNQFYTYLLLRPGADPAAVDRKFNAILDEHLPAEDAAATTAFLQPLTKIHLHSNLHRELAANSDVRYVYGFGAVAVLILLLACFNAINLSTAQATRRSREVGVRKVTGAGRGQLMAQFLGESFLLCGLAAILGLALVWLALPAVNAVLGRELRLALFDNWPLTLGLLGITALTALLAGAYPAFVLSAFRPERVLRDRILLQGRGGLRRVLVGLQFGIAIFLLIGVLVVLQQLRYIQERNLGFTGEQIINVPMRSPGTAPRADRLKRELLQLPGVLAVATSGNRPDGSDWGVPYQAVGLPEGQEPPMRCLAIDPDFVETYQMEIVAGRDLSADLATDTAAYLVNESAARALGWDDPLAHQLAMPVVERAPGPIVGIVKDFHFRSLHEEIQPIFMFYQPGWMAQFNIRLDAARSEEALAALERKWREIEPEFPFDFTFFDESFGEIYAAEQRMATLLSWFTGLALFITALGILGLTAFAAEQRRKEIGIRKVLGATAAGIIGLLARDFLRLVILAFLVAAPVAWYASRQWLDNFAYRTGIEWWMIVLAGLAALVLALLTVGLQSLRAATASPVASLRSE